MHQHHEPFPKIGEGDNAGFMARAAQYIERFGISRPLMLFMVILSIPVYFYWVIFSITNWRETLTIAYIVTHILLWAAGVLLGTFVVNKVLTTLLHLLRESAHTVEAIIHATGEPMRNKVLAMNSTHIVTDKRAPLAVSSVKEMHQTWRYNELGGEHEHLGIEGPDEEEEEPDAPPLSAIMNMMAETILFNKTQPLDNKRWLYGYVDGRPKFEPLIESKSIGFGGVTQQGKSSDMVLHAYQAAANGFKLLIIDPHMHLPGGLTPRLSPVKSAFLRPPIDDQDEDEIVSAFQYLDQELRERKKPGGFTPRKSVIVAMIDEWNALVNHALVTPSKRKYVINTITSLTSQGKKAGILLMLAAQTWDAQSIGIANVRQAFPARIAHHMEHEQMRKLLQCSDSTLLKYVDPDHGGRPLRPGQGLMATATGKFWRISVPWATNEDGSNLMLLSAGRRLPQPSLNTPPQTTLPFRVAVEQVVDPATLTATMAPTGTTSSTVISHFAVPTETGGFTVDQKLLEVEQQAAKLGVKEQDISDIIDLSKDPTVSNNTIITKHWGFASGGAEYQRAAKKLSAIHAVITARYAALLAQRDKEIASRTPSTNS